MADDERVDPLAEPLHPPGLPSRLALDRMDAGELSPEAEATLRAEIAAHPEGPALLHARREDEARLRAILPREAFVDGVLTRAAAEGSEAPASSPSLLARLRGALGRLFASPALVGALVTAALAVAVLPRLTGPGEGLIPKGSGPHDATLVVVRLEGQEVREVESGGVAHEGDQLQFILHPHGRAFALLFNLDDQGVFSPYYVGDDGESLPLDDKPTVILPWSIELDAFVGRERVVALLSDEPIPEEIVAAAVKGWMKDHRGGGPLPLTELDLRPYLDPGGAIEGLELLTFDLVKE